MTNPPNTETRWRPIKTLSPSPWEEYLCHAQSWEQPLWLCFEKGAWMDEDSNVCEPEYYLPETPQ